MDERSIVGLLGTLVVIAVAVIGVSAFVRNFVIGPAAGAQVLPTVAILVITAGVVAALVAWGAKTDRWRANPYW